MAITGYVWDVVRNLITLFIVAAIYSNIYDSETKLIFSSLLLIYLTILTVSAGITQQNTSIALLNVKLHLRAQKILLKSELEGLDEEERG